MPLDAVHWWAHPRSRGENSDPAYGMALSVGSSPLTRGKPSYSRRERCGGRLIPAHAGKTTTNTRDRKRSRAHPRSRGENLRHLSTELALLGSSPLTRGKLLRRRRVACGGRLIPAHAGKTARGRDAEAGPRAHPRSRGENSAMAAFCSATLGSSPLTRGKLELGPQPDDVPGLIPAHAGKTPPAPGVEHPPGAHPRSRGENEFCPPTYIW